MYIDSDELVKVKKASKLTQWLIIEEKRKEIRNEPIVEVKKENKKVSDCWRERAIFLIQKHYKSFYKRKQRDIHGFNEVLVASKGKIIDEIGVIIRIYCVEEAKQMKIKIYEISGSTKQIIILDNINCTEVIQNTSNKGIGKLIDTIEFDKRGKKFQIGLDEKLVGKRLNVLFSEQGDSPKQRQKPKTNNINNKVPYKIKVNDNMQDKSTIPRENNDPHNVVEDNESPKIGEIYRGLKKVKDEYYNNIISLVEK